MKAQTMSNWSRPQEPSPTRKPESTAKLPKAPTPGVTKVVIRRVADGLARRLRAGRQLTLLEWVLAEELLAIPRWKRAIDQEPSVSMLIESLMASQLRL
jgi:hypothetical protein